MAGKGKGSQWERDISRFFTEWLTGQKKELYLKMYDKLLEYMDKNLIQQDYEW